MNRKGLSILIVIFFLGVIVSGCAQKAVVKEDPSVKSADGSEARKDAKEADRIREEEDEKRV